MATFSGMYVRFVLSTDQFDAVCPGVSARARTESPISTATPQRVPATEINHISPFKTAPAVPDQPEAGNVFTEAS